MPETMVERLAKAIAEALLCEHDGLEIEGDYPEAHLRPWDGYCNREIDCMPVARAALQALREPTEAMEEAAEPYGLCMSAMEDAWRAMIDAALSKGAER